MKISRYALLSSPKKVLAVTSLMEMIITASHYLG